MIQIVENFFTDKQLKNVQDFALNKAVYTPKFFPNTTEKNDQNSYGNRFCFFQEKSNKLYKLFVNRAKLKFKINILKIKPDSGLDVRKLTIWKFHVDISKLNLLVMLHGEENIYKGTVFQTNQREVSTVVGFKPNRAILFPSKTYHSPHSALNNNFNVYRYSATMFIEKYNLV
jgi:hypothetical protein